MTILLLFLILTAIIFSKEIKAGCGVLLLYGLGLYLWDYFWGKVIVIVAITLYILAIITAIYEKICKWRGVTPFYDRIDEQ